MSFIDRLPHNRIKVEGNKPLLLNSSKFWLVQEGKADLFITRINNNTTGVRNYLFSVEKGDILLGIDPLAVPEGEFGLLAVGHTGTEFLEFDWHQFSGLPLESNNNEIAHLLKRWIEKWNIKGIKTDKQISWDTALITEQLPDFNQHAFSQALELLLFQKSEEVLRHKEKEVQDNSRMHSGLKRLMNTLNLKERDTSGDEEVFIDNLLYQACVVVGKSKKITIVPSYELKRNNAQSSDLLGDIARASQIRVRQIILKDTWWKEDNGALLAYKTEDGQPVALLPLSPTRYVLYDPADDSQVLVDNTVADTIKAQAYTFYRPLPTTAVGYKDLLRYLADGIWKSDITAVLVMGILGGLLGVLTPVVTGIIFDRVIPDGERLLLIQIGFLLIAIAITTFAFNLTRSFAMHRIEGRSEADLQAAIWDRLLSLPVPFFKGNCPVGPWASAKSG